MKLKSKKSGILLIIAGIVIFSGSNVLATDSSLKHDLDNDGRISIMDMVSLKKNIIEKASYSKDYDYSADLNINSIDTVVLKEYLVSLTMSFSAEQSEAILEPKGAVHTGEATYYGGGYEGGCAMLDPVSKDYLIAAMNIFDYNTAQLAGAYLSVTGERGSAKIFITDLLPEGKKGDLDLHTDTFPYIADPIKGRVPVSWKIIPFETHEPVSYKFKDGSTQFWCGVQVRNHRYPVTKLEYLNSSGEFVELPRRNYNYFESFDMGAGPFTFRVTDIYGQVIVDRNISFLAEAVFKGQKQFPI